MKTTGSVRKTLLDSLLMEAAMMCELTASRFLSCHGPSASIFTVAFSVDRKEPKFLYITNTTLTCPAKRRETNEKMNRNKKKKKQMGRKKFYKGKRRQKKKADAM